MILDIDVPKDADTDAVIAVVDAVCASETLHVSLQTTLKQHPDSVHWHFKNGRMAGVLEVTWWPRGEENERARLWLSVHGNRMADWIEALFPKLKVLLETRLREAV